MTTRPYRFPEELRESLGPGAGPDFPGSSGDREKGKFRPSAIPRRTTVAVVGDDGLPIVRPVGELLSELLLWQKASLIAQMWVNDGLTFSISDVLEEANKL